MVGGGNKGREGPVMRTRAIVDTDTFLISLLLLLLFTLSSVFSPCARVKVLSIIIVFSFTKYHVLFLRASSWGHAMFATERIGEGVREREKCFFLENCRYENASV